MLSMKLVLSLLTVLMASLLLANIALIQDASALSKLSISLAAAEDPIQRGSI